MMMMIPIVVASLLLGSMLAGHAQAQGCWETDSCYDGYYDPNDLNGQDYYVNDYYVDDDFEGKWVSIDAYDDYYAYVDPEDYVDCYVQGTCYDGYYDPNDPNGLDYYVEDLYVDDDFEGYWVSDDDYADYYAGFTPEEYPASGVWCPVTTDGVTVYNIPDLQYESIYGEACNPNVVKNANEPPPAAPGVNPADVLNGIGNLIAGIGQAAGHVIHGGR